MKPSIANRFDIISYLLRYGFKPNTSLASALIFQLPIYFLRGSHLTARSLCIYRRHAMVAVMVLEAIITPCNELASNYCPIYVLYQHNILLLSL